MEILPLAPSKEIRIFLLWMDVRLDHVGLLLSSCQRQEVEASYKLSIR